jgi:alkyldihydroxyacetonephosphate synthase
MIAYIRDMALKFNIVAESFETSCPWSNVTALCKNVRAIIKEYCIKYGGQTERSMWCSFRVTQLYETGAAVYIYFSINYENMPLEQVSDVYEEIEARTRDEVFRQGGCISHHHGVGKLRKRFME